MRPLHSSMSPVADSSFTRGRTDVTPELNRRRIAPQGQARTHRPSVAIDQPLAGRTSTPPHPGPQSPWQRARKTAAAVLLCLMALTTAFALTPAFAQMQRITIYRTGILNGVILPEGTYRLEVAPTLDAVTVFRNRQEIVKAPCRIALIERPLLGDSVSYGRAIDGKEAILRIQLQDTKLSFDFDTGIEQSPAVAKAEAGK